jgi:hypothetical protein
LLLAGCLLWAVNYAYMHFSSDRGDPLVPKS